MAKTERPKIARIMPSMFQPVSVRGVSSSHELRRHAVTNGERAGMISSCIDHLPREVDFFVSTHTR